ncbi:MAG: septum formation initiator family protein [Acidimicrobiales bacterium]
MTRHRSHHRAWPWLVVVALIGVSFIGVFPSRTYLSQRRTLDGAERRLEVLAAENARLAERARQLMTDAEIERLAREQYNLVRPGEEAYAILPEAFPRK